MVSPRLDEAMLARQTQRVVIEALGFELSALDAGQLCGDRCLAAAEVFRTVGGPANQLFVCSLHDAALVESA